MATLGFIRSSEQRPAGCPRIFIRSSADARLMSGRPVLNSWPAKSGVQEWEMCFEVREGLDALPHWAAHMAGALRNLSLAMWWLDISSVAKCLDRYEPKALALWGEVFWPVYDCSAVVLLDIAEMRDDLAPLVSAWEMKFAHVRFAPEHDYDNLERERAAAEAARAKTSLWSRLMSRDRAAG